jgi:SAM-dependent methyltransferase
LENGVSWRKYLLVPRLAAAGLRHRPDPDDAWQSYWSGVGSTGPGGEVLWDGAGDQELRWWRDTTRRYFDRTLPVLDVGCGNGRLSRLVAADFPSVLGIDVSPAAVDLARRESRGLDRVAFRQADITADGVGADLAAELGPANVIIRGVLHVLDDDQQQRAVEALATVLGDRGAVVLLETNWHGDALDYLEYLGGRSGRLPPAVDRLIKVGVPRPSSLGPSQVSDLFPPSGWEVVASGPVDIAVVGGSGANGRAIPGFHAVLRPSRHVPS